MELLSGMDTLSLNVAFYFDRLLGPRRALLRDVAATSGVLFFLYHVWYLSKGRFDYGYNMKVNVIVGKDFFSLSYTANMNEYCHVPHLI